MISVTSSNDVFTVGDTTSINVNFNANVNVTGTPELRLFTGENDAYAAYSSGSGTSDDLMVARPLHRRRMACTWRQAARFGVDFFLGDGILRTSC